MQLLFIETQRERTQEFVLKWSHAEGQPGWEVVRQQYHFSPQDATRELEDYQVTLARVRTLELTIVPDRTGGGAHATLESLRLA